MDANVVIQITTHCPCCLRAKRLLEERGVSGNQEIMLDGQPERRDCMIARSGRRTVPQVFAGGYHVGGCDDLAAPDRRGQWRPMLQGVLRARCVVGPDPRLSGLVVQYPASCRRRVGTRAGTRLPWHSQGARR